MPVPSGLELTLLLLLAAVLGVVGFRLLQLPPMLGYLAVGAVIGPHALGVVPQAGKTSDLAEFGVVFLMFAIGLEFDLAKLRALRTTVFGLGLAQVVATIVIASGGLLGLSWAIGAGASAFLPVDGSGAFALGAALAMSSTAIVVKLLVDKLALETPHGRQIIGVLLFQDLAVVPLLIVIPSIGAGMKDMVSSLGIALAKAALVLSVLLFFGQRLMRGWFHIVAKRRSQELFMLNLLLITLGLAWITEHAGLSLALGAFVAGILIAETEYRHQVEQDIKPFQDVLLGLFFITIGMLLNPRVLIDHWALVVVLLVVPMLLKCVLIAGLARAFGSTPGTSIRIGLGLCTAGEFGFVLLNQAGMLGLVPPALLQVVLASMLLSMLLTPFIIEHTERITMRLARSEWMMASLNITKIAAKSIATEQHVIICGYGRSGQNLARLLDSQAIGYVALDLDPDRVREAAAAGDSVVFGDAARRDSLIAAGLMRAQAIAITYADTPSALKVLAHVRDLAPHLPVIVRTLDDSDLDKLREAGAAEVVPEVIEGSLMLATHTLVLLGVPLGRVLRVVKDARDQRYAHLRGFFHGADDDASESSRAQVRLHSVPLPPGAAAVGRPLGELGLELIGVEVTSVRSGVDHPLRRVDHDPHIDRVLVAGDIVVVRGVPEALALAEERLLAR